MSVNSLGVTVELVSISIAQQLSVYREINLISVVIVPLNVIYLFRNQKNF